MRIGFDAQSLDALDSLTTALQEILPMIGRGAICRWAVTKALATLDDAPDLRLVALEVAGHQPTGGRPIQGATSAAQLPLPVPAPVTSPDPDLDAAPAEGAQGAGAGLPAGVLKLARQVAQRKGKREQKDKAKARLAPHLRAMQDDGLSQAAIGERLGLSVATVARILRADALAKGAEAPANGASA